MYRVTETPEASPPAPSSPGDNTTTKVHHGQRAGGVPATPPSGCWGVHRGVPGPPQHHQGTTVSPAPRVAKVLKPRPLPHVLLPWGVLGGQGWALPSATPGGSPESSRWLPPWAHTALERGSGSRNGPRCSPCLRQSRSAASSCSPQRELPCSELCGTTGQAGGQPCGHADGHKGTAPRRVKTHRANQNCPAALLNPQAEGWDMQGMSFRSQTLQPTPVSGGAAPRQGTGGFGQHTAMAGEQAGSRGTGKGTCGRFSSSGRGRGIEWLLALAQRDAELSTGGCCLARRAGSAGGAVNGAAGEAGAVPGGAFWETPSLVLL